MMYPALACMEDRGHVSIQPEGNRKRYALSDEGRAHLDANRERVDLMLAKLAAAAEKMTLMRNALAEGGAADDGRGQRWTTEFAEARHALKHALQAHAGPGVSAEEQGRIAAILARATAEIELGPGEAQA
jgi:DNA-binding PadR family transcriptional regulator